MLLRRIMCALCLLPCYALVGQGARQASLQAAFDQAEATGSLTANGSPFHAEMKIAGTKKEPPYDGFITVDWASSTKYRVEVRSVAFHQVQTRDGDQLQEVNEGDFYPGWLHSFVTALLDPMSVKALFVDPKASLSGSRSSDGGGTKECIDRNDRPGGITEEMTWGGICISSDGLLQNVHNFVSWMDFSDYRDFAGKKIARSYASYAGNYDEISGKLILLRPLQLPEVDAIRVTQVTPPDKRIGFAFVSTKEEEARRESVKPFEWPPVREGRTEGFMIVHALTDVNGQVRETSKHNSDNATLEEAGRQAAIGYKFKPMLVDGVPVEMDMPLVLHFASKIADPVPVLRGAELLRQIKGCDAELVPASKLSGAAKPTRMTVNEEGKLTEEAYGSQVEPGDPAVVVTPSSGPIYGPGWGCRFTPLRRGGTVTKFFGDLLVSRNR